MRHLSRNQAIAAGIAFLALCSGLLVTLIHREETVPPLLPEVQEETLPFVTHEVIGTSVEGRAIEAYSYGHGETDLLFVGGIHGGYEWNSVLLAYAMMDHFEENPSIIPPNLTVTVIPSANPDGVFAVLGKEGRFGAIDVPTVEPGTGRFNANGVDLNRNFDCKWQPESTWRGNTVSAGTKAFSEPEAQALRSVVSDTSPAAVVFWHSQSNAVYASECEAGILPQTRAVMEIYATAAGYPSVDVFDAYPITGDAEGWLASVGIPAITVELATHESIEWAKNLAGVEALLAHYAALPMPDEETAESTQSAQTSIRGTLVCLPHRNTQGPQTLECALGLLDEKGNYYGLRDSDPLYKNVSGIPGGASVEVFGAVAPESDAKYESIGTITVTDIQTLSDE